MQSQDETLMEDVFKKVDQYFGDGFNDLAADQLDVIRRSPWQFDFEFSELMDKYNSLRMLFNDRRRKRNKTLRYAYLFLNNMMALFQRIYFSLLPKGKNLSVIIT